MTPLRGLSEVLRHELEGSRIRVSVIHPGGIATNIAARARYHDDVPAEARALYAEQFASVARTSPERAAEVIARGIAKNTKRILIDAEVARRTGRAAGSA